MEPTVEVDIEEVEEVGRGSESIGEGRAVKAAVVVSRRDGRGGGWKQGGGGGRARFCGLPQWSGPRYRRDCLMRRRLI